MRTTKNTVDIKAYLKRLTRVYELPLNPDNCATNMKRMAQVEKRCQPIFNRSVGVV